MTQPSTDLKTISGEIEHPLGKFWINEKAFVFNPDMQPLIVDFHIKAIQEQNGSIFYTQDKQKWVREDFVYKNRYSAYRALIKQAESEIIEPINTTPVE